MFQRLKLSLADEKGTTMVEYALLVVLLALSALGADNLFHAALINFYNRICLVRTGILGMWP